MAIVLVALVALVVVAVVVAVIVSTSGNRKRVARAHTSPPCSPPPAHQPQAWPAPDHAREVRTELRSDGATPARYAVPALLFVVGAGLVMLRYVALDSNVPIVLGGALVLASVVVGVIAAATSGTNDNPRAVASPYPVPGTNGLAVASLVLGLVGVSLLAVIFGHVARSQLRRVPQAGRGLATAGLVLGYVGIALSIIVVVALASIVSSSGY